VILGLAVMPLVIAVPLLAVYAPRWSHGGFQPWCWGLVVPLSLFYLTFRLATVCVRADRDQLLVRSVVTTRRLPWAGINEASLEPSPLWVSLVSRGFAQGSRVRVDLGSGHQIRPIALYRTHLDPKPAAMVTAINDKAMGSNSHSSPFGH